MTRVFVPILLLLGMAVTSCALRCHEGFDMSLSGIPLQYWQQRECTGDSKCMRQELKVNDVAGTPFWSSLQYGACMNINYADYMACENLFGKDSTFDPAQLLDMVPGMVQSVNNSVQIFSQNAAVGLWELLSNGTGPVSLVDGTFTFYGMMGFKLDKAVPLKPSLANLLKAAFGGNPRAIYGAITEFVEALRELDTENVEYAAALRNVLTTAGVPLATIGRTDPTMTVLIDRMPGLVKSILPSSWQAAYWYDVAFKLLANVDGSNWVKTTEDMVATIKSSYQIPSNISKFVLPILDAIPDLVRGSQLNVTYVGRWSLELLKKFSVSDKATQDFASALITFIETITQSTLQYEYKTMIQWMPGLFYEIFPENKTIIQQVYTTMSSGIKTFDVALAVLGPDTKLSMMIENMITRFMPPGNPLPPQAKKIIVTLSNMFYKLMKMNSVDYTTYVDDFSTVIDDEFKKWPNINVGEMMENLITKMGGEVPAELSPLLENVQPIVTGFTQMDFASVSQGILSVIFRYKLAYPDSPFPELVTRFTRLMTQFFNTLAAGPGKAQEVNNINLEIQLWNVDLQFAIVKTYYHEWDELYQKMSKAWPEFHLYIRILKATDPKDVKELIKDLVTYFARPRQYSAKGFVDVVKPTFMKMTKSITKLLGEMRQWYAPDSCKFGSCDEDLCNTRDFVVAKEEFKKDLAFALATPRTATMTSSGLQLSPNVILNIATLWISSRIFR